MSPVHFGFSDAADQVAARIAMLDIDESVPIGQAKENAANARNGALMYLRPKKASGRQSFSMHFDIATRLFFLLYFLIFFIVAFLISQREAQSLKEGWIRCVDDYGVERPETQLLAKHYHRKDGVSML